MGALRKVRSKLKRIFAGFNITKYAKSQGVNLGENVRFVSVPDFGSEPWLITIKDNVLVTGNVTFITHDGSVSVVKRLDEKYSKVVKFGKIVIEEGSFIGNGSTIMPNVRIGKNAIVAARSCVTKDVPDGAVVGGVPAKIIGNVYDLAEKWYEMTPEYDDNASREDKKKWSTEIAEHYWKLSGKE